MNRGTAAYTAHVDTFARENLPAPLAFYLATQLPLVVVIAAIGVETDRLSPSTAAALVAAAMVSVLAYPMIAARLRQRPSAA